ncbi:unnamed protein product [Lepeophtheirus salmonis]|uniref:(salmon louse) hypothetical protein n=1 Tax=Lepeophtheirus salmonis TaxID=72036 RepID=A0A7R8CYK6_LEPSM|nr:unnamed protein product [Lepeophtheirus salmonis]CAF2969327.1 unnamed protein product [Lepeophtheirus salmonis]
MSKTFLLWDLRPSIGNLESRSDGPSYLMNLTTSGRLLQFLILSYKASFKFILNSIGIKCDNLDLVLKSLPGRSREQIIEDGKKKLASLPSSCTTTAGGAPKEEAKKK